jgi:hypothetical protein
MHRVNQKTKKVLALRFLAYGLTIFLTIITTATLLYIALGYRFDTAGHVVQNGLLLVDNRPQAARILIDNIVKDNASPGRFVLPATTHHLSLSREGYRQWQKDVDVAPGSVRTVHYPVLIPEKLKSSSVANLENPYLASQSLDKKQLILHQENAPTFDLITLRGDAQAHKVTSLTIPSNIPREDGLLGTFTVIEWALNNKQLLLTQTLPSGKTNVISFDVTKPESAINITALYGDRTPADVHYVGGETSMIYGLKDGVLSRYNLEEDQIDVLLSDVRAYHQYGDAVVVYDRLKADAVEIGVWQNERAVTVHSFPMSDPPAVLRYFQYDNHYYLAITNAAQPEVVIYRDPVKKPILPTQLPYVTIPVGEAAQLLVSPSSQFIFIRSGSQVIVHDFEDVQNYRFTLDARAEGTKVTWVTGHHLSWQDKEGSNYLLEYDGSNQQQLQRSIVGRPTLFTGDMEGAYDIVTNESQQQLHRTPLVLE